MTCSLTGMLPQLISQFPVSQQLNMALNLGKLIEFPVVG